MVKSFHTQFLKQSMFEASEALHKVEGTKKIKTLSFHQYSWNSEVEKTWITLIGWPHKTSTVEPLANECTYHHLLSRLATYLPNWLFSVWGYLQKMVIASSSGSSSKLSKRGNFVRRALSGGAQVISTRSPASV